MTTDYDEKRSNSGSIFIEIDLDLESDSGRDKHLDLDEQGAWIAEYIWRSIQESPVLVGAKDIKVPRMKYWGQTIKVGVAPIKTF